MVPYPTNRKYLDPDLTDEKNAHAEIIHKKMFFWILNMSKTC